MSESNSRNYISEMRHAIAFSRKLKLSPRARLLWLCLIEVDNSAYWPEWFLATLDYLRDYTGLKKETIIRARDELFNHGILDYKTNGKNPTRYKLTNTAVPLPKGEGSVVQKGDDSVVQKGDDSVVQKGDALKT
ncbi:MAG: helix-turn-helix domain-containing protein [Clostridia bacterium]|nr:helix-turn-helix domain-containing protein [Clostridia bacterium]